jgi:hypothetical protein
MLFYPQALSVWISGPPLDHACHAAAVRHRFGGIHDGIHLLFGDLAIFKFLAVRRYCS